MWGFRRSLQRRYRSGFTPDSLFFPNRGLGHFLQPNHYILGSGVKNCTRCRNRAPTGQENFRLKERDFLRRPLSARSERFSPPQNRNPNRNPNRRSRVRSRSSEPRDRRWRVHGRRDASQARSDRFLPSASSVSTASTPVLSANLGTGLVSRLQSKANPTTATHSRQKRSNTSAIITSRTRSECASRGRQSFHALLQST